MPEGGGRPQGGSGEEGKGRPGFESFAENLQTQQIDIGDAHISKQTDDIKESGSLEDLTPGTMVTITLDGKGKVTYVLITSTFSFGGFGGFGGGFGNFSPEN